MENALVFGTFDGVHLGHRSVIESVKGYNIIAVTFKVPPKSVADNKQNLLFSEEKRVDILKRSGVSEVLMLDFCEVKDISHEVFLKEMTEKFNPRAISCGFNFRFGKDALGDNVYLRDFCRQNGIEFFCSDCVKINGNTVSSSYIRTLIENGIVEKANSLMSEDFGYKAVVVEGDRRGRMIGFPTANQIYPDGLVKAKFGVYESKVIIDGKCYKSITDLGIRPTFKTEKTMSETFIFGFEGDLYGKAIELFLIRFLREEKKFSGIDELKHAIENDINKIR